MIGADDTPRPFAVDELDVGEGHRLHVEQFGRPGAKPAVFLHGGPGSGASPRAARSFDLDRYHIVVFDQRGAGRSTPHASDPGLDWTTIDLERHVADIERVRVHAGIERWLVFGGSWGFVLGIAYAERHPQRVTEAVVVSGSTSTRADIDWLTVETGRFFPAEWEAFRNHVPAHLRDRRLVDAYAELLMDRDPAVHEPAAIAWCRWEEAHVATTPSAAPDPRYCDARFRLAFARQVTHCWRNESWLDDDELVRRAGRLADIPGWLLHGRLDVSSPLVGPWRLHRAWPGSKLVVVAGDGHSGAGLRNEWTAILRQLGER